MRILAFDMTSPRITVGLSQGCTAVGRWDVESSRGRSGTLDALIDRALSESGWTRQNIEGLALVIGPGSLTATRIGWATASGWSLAARIPVTGWASYAVQKRWWAADDGDNSSIACVVHHRGDEFYMYDLSGPGRRSIPLSITLGHWRPEAPFTKLVGSGILGYRERWVESLGSSVTVVTDEEAIVGGDTLAVWGEEAIASGFMLDPMESPLDYGLPPEFRKSTR